MITEEMVRAGYKAGMVRVIDSPYEDGAVCQIGKRWLYFWNFGSRENEMRAEELMATHNEVEIIHEIWRALNELRHATADMEEMDYFEELLQN